MRIISDFVDYYDLVKENYYSPGVPEVTFVRKSEKCGVSQVCRVKSKLSEDKTNSIKIFTSKNGDWSMSFFAVGFCKNIYRGVLIDAGDMSDVSYTLTGAICIPSKLGIVLPKEVQDTAEKHFFDWKDCCPSSFEDVEAPYFVILPNQYNSLTIVKNPRLADYRFVKIMNTYNAFHAIKSNLMEQHDKTKTSNDSNVWSFNPFLSAFLKATYT